MPPSDQLDLVSIDAVIFDMDGLLVESESLWRRAEQEASDALGLGYTTADFDRTTGIRIHDITRIWAAERSWGPSPTPDEVGDRIIDRMCELVAERDPLPGAVATVEACVAAGLRVALCSSSTNELIGATLKAIGLVEHFEFAHSAEDDPYGKPHPDPYLATARLLGVEPSRCVAFEDSVTGAIAARAARMRVIAVPDPALRGSEAFGFADVTLASLEDFDLDVLRRLDAGVRSPSLFRPRFHLAFGVDDLDAARAFYGGVLGCREGRSDERWVDFDLHGHQIVAHLDDASDATLRADVATNPVDGHEVPAHHFGLVLPVAAWRRLADRLAAADVPFLMEPTTRFTGEIGEQHTLFVTDPAGNALEFKAFVADEAVFCADPSAP